MIQNPITFVVSNNGTILGGQRGTIRALSNYASKIYLVAPFESVSVKANYLIYESKREIIGQYLAPTTLKGSDVLAPNDPQYQTAGQWSVWETSISQRALHRIAKYRAGRIGVSFEFTSITQPPQIASGILRGLIKTDHVLPNPATYLNLFEDSGNGDYYIVDQYNYTDQYVTGELTKGDYVYFKDNTWLKGQNIAQVAMTTTQDLAVDPSLQAEIPEDISEDEELENLIDTLISDVGDLSTDLTAHIADLNDPHDTQANQVDGTYRSQASHVQASLDTVASEIDGIVDGEIDITYNPSANNIITKTTVAEAIGELDSATHTHITSFNNPHNVVAGQVNVLHQGSTVTVQTAITDLQTDKVEKDAPTITSITGTNKVYVNDGSDKLITVANLRTFIVDELVSFSYEKFTEKDENGQPVIANPRTNRIYLFLLVEATNDLYEEWIYISEDDSFEQIGTTEVQLANYYDKDEVDDLLDGKSDVGHIHDDRYYTETEMDGFLQVAKQIHYYPNTKNDSGLLIPKGTVVQFAGSQGDFIKIKSAVPSEIASNPELLMGIAESDIAIDAFGNVVWFGQIIELVINPNVFDNGDILYFDFNTGGLTKVAPTENKIIIAAVQKVSTSTNATNGILIVRPKWVSRNINEVDGLQSALDGKEPANANIQSHIADSTIHFTQSAISITKSQVSDFAHNHDDRYYTETELDNGQLDNRYYTETELNNGQLDNRYYTETELNNGQLDNRYYTETEINNILLNDTNTTHTQTESIKSVPVGTIDGQVSGFEAEGLTLENSFENGNFASNSGLLYQGGLVGANTDGTSTVSYSSNKKILTGTGTFDVSYFYTNVFLNTTDTIFLYAQAKITNNLTTLITLSLGSSFQYQLFNPIQNQTYDLYVKGLSSDGRFSSLNQYANTANATNAVTEYDNFVLINMTALGIASYTEAQMLDLVRSGYFDGLTSVEQPSITSVGKNLLDINDTTPNFYVDYTTGNLISNVNYVVTNFIRIKGATTYYFTNANLNIAFYDSSFNYISATLGVGSDLSFSKLSPANAQYVRVSILKVNISNGVQLEQGSTATAYEPYKSSTLALNTPLRSLPNGVRDRVYEQNGEVWLEKRIEEYVLQSADFAQLATSPTNLDFVQVNQPLDFINYASGYTPNDTSLVEGFFETAYADETSKIGGYATDGSANSWLFLVANGTYANLAAAQADLAGTVIQYQLATPQLINLTQQGLADGQITAYANGTVYNTSDTFHADINFDVASNRSAQISALIDNSDYQAKLIDSKASKVQEDWIEPTLLNGWVSDASGNSNASYYKDEFGIVRLKGLIISGTITSGTVLFTLPVGYRPIGTRPYIVSIFTTESTFGVIEVNSSGQVVARIVSASTTNLNQIAFRAEQ